MVKFEVIYTVWGADDVEFAGGVHEVDKPSADFLRCLAGAEAAGAVKILEAAKETRSKLKGHVQSQAEGEKVWAESQNVYAEDGTIEKQGPWHHGNLAQAVSDLEYRISVVDTYEDEDTAAVLRAQLDQAKAALKDAVVPE